MQCINKPTCLCGGGCAKKQLNIAKPVQTRCGNAVRVLCTDRKGGVYPIVALVTIDGREYVRNYTAEGRYINGGTDDGKNDLVNTTAKKWKWVVWSSPRSMYLVTQEYFTKSEVNLRWSSVMGHITETEIEE